VGFADYSWSLMINNSMINSDIAARAKVSCRSFIFPSPTVALGDFCTLIPAKSFECIAAP